MTSDNYTNNRLNYNSNNCLSHSNWRKHFPLQGKLYPLTNTQNFHSNTFFRTLLVVLMMVVGNVDVWGQHPFTLTTQEQHDAHSGETLYWIESFGATGFFMIPKENRDDKGVSTSNMPNEMMLWYFMDAEISNETQYYYIVNKSTGKYLRLMGNNGDDNSIGIKTYADNNDSFKFSIIKGNDQWLIQPYSSKNHYVNKKASNVNYANGLKSSTYGAGDPNSEWKFVAKDDVIWAHPFTNSTDEEKHYFLIQNKHKDYTNYYMSVDESYVSVSTDNNDYRVWYFKEASSDASIPNMKYYYIVNANTGNYMYFNSNTLSGDQIGSSANAVEIRSYSSGENEDRYQFAIMDAKGDKYSAYSIMPKKLIALYNDKYNALGASDMSNNLHIGTLKDRGSNDNQAHWTFTETTFAWTDPEVSCDLNGNITITQAEGADVYYTTDGSTIPTTESNPYDAENKPTVSDGITIIKVRAIRGVKEPSNVVTKTIVYNPTITFTAGLFTYTGLAQNPISSVDVNTTHLEATDYNIAFKKGGVTADFKDAGDYTIELTAAEGSDYVVSGTSSETISIAQATLTATAEDKSVTYGSDAPAYTVSYSGFLNGDSEEDITTPPTFYSTYSTTSNVGTYPIRISMGVATNYSFKYRNGTLTVTPATATVTADEGKTKVYGEADPELTATVTGLLNSDSESVITYTLSRAEGENVGTYAITPSGDELQGNYSVNYVSKDFTITKAPLTVTAKNHAITYGDAPSNGGVSYSGFVNSDTKSVLSGTLTYTYSYSQYGDIGNSYTITPNGLTAANYNLSYNNGTLTVNQKEIGLSWDGTPLIYNGDPHTLTANATGLVNSDEIVVTVTLSAQEGSSLTDGNAVNAGNYLATASSISGPKAGNYKLPSTDTHLFTISPKVLGDGTRASSGIDVMMTKSGTSYIVTVTDTEIDENTLLTENTDYTLSEANDVVTISGINNYTGSARLIYATATFATPDEEHIPAKDGYGAAYMSAMDVLPPSDVKVYVVKKVSPTIGTVTLSEIDYIPEGVPVIMLADNDQTGFAASPIDFTSASIVPISDAVRKSNLLRVSNGSIEVKDAQAYMFYRGEFVLTLAGTIGARKFFIYNPDYTEKTTPAFVRYLQFVIEDDETSINEELKEKNDKIATDESWYTLDGQRLNGRPARKGLYIMNGKKMTLDGK